MDTNRRIRTLTSDLKLVIFDCDGVLIDSEIVANRIEHQELIKLGHSISFEKFIEIGVGRREHEIEQLLKVEGVDIPEGFWDKTRALIFEAFFTTLAPINGVIDVLEKLTYQKCIASSSPKVRLDMSLSITGLTHYFNGAVFDGTMVSRGKPHPDLFLLAAKAFGVMAEECLVIEDSIPGVIAAVRAEMPVWGFIGGGHCTSSSSQRLKEAGADLIFQEMQQLPNLIETAFLCRH